MKRHNSNGNGGEEGTKKKQKVTLVDTSGALIVLKWKSAWKYRDHHIRVTMSDNPLIPEDTVFSNSKMTAIMLRLPSYFTVHKAIVLGRPLDGCYLEYTITKIKNKCSGVQTRNEARL